MADRIRVQSTVLGFPAVVDVQIYPDLDTMRAAAQRYAPAEDGFANAYAVTQAWYRTNPDGTRQVRPIIRLARTHLWTEIVAHEMHHATTGIYGGTLPPGTPATDVLTHHNEDFAWLHGALLARLVNRLHALGYYDQETP